MIAGRKAVIVDERRCIACNRDRVRRHPDRQRRGGNVAVGVGDLVSEDLVAAGALVAAQRVGVGAVGMDDEVTERTVHDGAAARHVGKGSARSGVNAGDAVREAVRAR